MRKKHWRSTPNDALWQHSGKWVLAKTSESINSDEERVADKRTRYTRNMHGDDILKIIIVRVTARRLVLIIVTSLGVFTVDFKEHLSHLSMKEDALFVE